MKDYGSTMQYAVNFLSLKPSFQWDIRYSSMNHNTTIPTLMQQSERRQLTLTTSSAVADVTRNGLYEQRNAHEDKFSHSSVITLQRPLFALNLFQYIISPSLSFLSILFHSLVLSFWSFPITSKPSNPQNKIQETFVKMYFFTTPLPNKTGNVRINVTLRRVRITIVAVDKQSHIPSVCRCECVCVCVDVNVCVCRFECVCV